MGPSEGGEARPVGGLAVRGRPPVPPGAVYVSVHPTPRGGGEGTGGGVDGNQGVCRDPR